MLCESSRPLVDFTTNFSQAPFSEMYGRRPVFLVLFSIFTLFTLETALAKDTAAVLLCGFLAGATGSSVLVTSVAIIGDVGSASNSSLYR